MTGRALQTELSSRSTLLCARRCYVPRAWNDLLHLRELSLVQDAPRFLQCFMTALQGAASADDIEFPWNAPMIRQLQPQDWF